MSQHLLFITSSRIGDAVLSTALLDHMVRSHPGLRVTVACGRLSAPLFANVPGLEQVIIVDKQSYNRHWLTLWTKTVGRRWDVLVDLRVSAMSWFLLAKKRYWLVSTSGKTPDHRLVRMGRLMGLFPPPFPHLWLSDKNRAAAQRLTAGDTPLIALSPFANSGDKEWPLSRYIDLAKRLLAPGSRFATARLVLIGSGSERARATPFFDAIDPTRLIDLFGQDDLLDVQAVLERCLLFVGNDSGVMHMAAAAKIPTVGLFGPTRDWLYAPMGPKTITVRDDGIVDGALWDPRPVRVCPASMDGLSVDTVDQAIDTLWRRTEQELS